MQFENIILEKKDKIATVTLNRPQAINAWNLGMLRDMDKALQNIEHDDDIDVMILTAAGTKGFCGGMDLKDFENGLLDLDLTKKVFDGIEDLSKPTIGAITDGYCITGGLESALSCDILIASDKAIFGDTHCRISISGGGAGVRMPRLIGLMEAKYMLFTSRFFDALEAKRRRLVVEVYPSEKLQEEARGIALEIMKQDKGTVRRMKRLMNRAWRMDLYGAWCLEEAECLRSMQIRLAQGFRMEQATAITRSIEEEGRAGE